MNNILKKFNIEEKTQKKQIKSNYIILLIAYIMIGYILYLDKSVGEFAGGTSAFTFFFIAPFLIAISLILLAQNIVQGVLKTLEQKNMKIIINLVILILLHIPFIIFLLKLNN